jgi:DNA-directed RNA polymerase specialized sigma24 family protein
MNPIVTILLEGACVVSSDFDPEPLEAFDRAFTPESIASIHFHQKVEEGLRRVVMGYETRWRRSLALDPSIARHEASGIVKTLAEMSQNNPGGVRALVLHWFVGLSMDETAEHCGWSITATRSEIGLASAILETFLARAPHSGIKT